AGNHPELALSQYITRSSIDNPVFPSSGSEFSLSVTLAYLPLTTPPPNEPANYFRTQLTMKFYSPLLSVQGTNRLTLATVADIGQIGMLGAHPFVPVTDLFLMGGSGLGSAYFSVPLRGYEEGSIGVRPISGSDILEPGRA